MKNFENTNISLDIPCDSTIKGKCIQTETLEDCTNICKPPNCYWGTWSKDTKICKAVNFPIYKEVNPGFLLKPEQPGMTTFIDTNFFEFPAQRNNRIFFYDRVKIQNVETGYIMEPAIRLRMTKPSLPLSALEVVPITTKSPVLFYDRNLDSVLRVEGNNVNWYKAIEFLNEDYEAFFIEPVIQEVDKYRTPYPSEKKNIYYSDVFHIRTVLQQYIALPPMYAILKPRLNDLIVSSDIYKSPYTFRFVYIPSKVEFS